MADPALTDTIRRIVAMAIENGDPRSFADAGMMLRGIRQYRLATHGPEDVGVVVLSQDIIRLERLAADPTALAHFRAAHASALQEALTREEKTNGDPRCV